MNRKLQKVRNARQHDARALLAIAARMQTRGDSFALADTVVSVAGNLTKDAGSLTTRPGALNRTATASARDRVNP